MTRVDVYYGLAPLFLVAAEITLFYAPAHWVIWAFIPLSFLGGIFTALGRRALKKQRAEYQAAKKIDAEKALAELKQCLHPNTRTRITLSEVCSKCGQDVQSQPVSLRPPCKHLNTHHEGSLGEFCDECGAPV